MKNVVQDLILYTGNRLHCEKWALRTKLDWIQVCIGLCRNIPLLKHSSWGFFIWPYTWRLKVKITLESILMHPFFLVVIITCNKVYSDNCIYRHPITSLTNGKIFKKTALSTTLILNAVLIALFTKFPMWRHQKGKSFRSQKSLPFNERIRKHFSLPGTIKLTLKAAFTHSR